MAVLQGASDSSIMSVFASKCSSLILIKHGRKISGAPMQHTPLSAEEPLSV
jgi:hypothetical protein